MDYDWVDILERLATAAPLPADEAFAKHGNVLAVGTATYEAQVWRFVCFGTSEPTTLDDLRSALSEHLVYAVDADDHRVGDIPIDQFEGLPEALGRGTADGQKVFIVIGPA